MRHSTVRFLVLALILTPCGVLGFARNAAAQAFVDFGGAPANPTQFLRVYDNSDNLYPNDAGYKAMADTVDLSIFTRL